jgi:hypothetical protein
VIASAKTISRRRLLRGLGGATLSIPLLSSLAGEGHAQTYTPPRRFVFVFSSNGQRPENWWPEWQPAWQTLGSNVRAAPLQTTSDGSITPILGPEFAPLVEKLTLIRGLDHYRHGSEGHFAPSVLSASPEEYSITMDQVLAYSNKVYPTPPALRSMHMLIKQEFQSMGPSASVDASNNDVPHELSVATSFNRAFANFIEPDADPTVEQRHALKVGVIDRVRGEYDLLLKSPRLSAADRERLEAHLELVHDLHARLAGAGAGPACSKPDAPTDLDDSVDENLPQITRDNIDLVVAALKCDRVRVVTLMLCPETDLRDFGFLGLPGGEHHALSHDAGYSESASMALRSVNNWYAQQVAHLLSSLDVVEDSQSGATYLDNSVVFWGNSDGCNSFDAHKPFCMPVLLAGGCGGYFQTGRYLDYRHQGERIHYGDCGSGGDEPTDDKGRPFNSLLISLMTAMGLEAADWEASPGAGFGNYDDNYCNDYSQSEGRQVLPFLAV